MANAGLRPMRCASFVIASMPTNAPMFCTMELMPIQRALAPAISATGRFCSRKERSMTGPTSSGAKNPIPHSPITPETERIIPKIAGPRQRASPKSSA